MNARLTNVQSDDQEEFADLIGTEGELHLSEDGPNYFFPKNSGDILTLTVKRIVKNDKATKVFTKLKNCFIFKENKT